MHRHVICGVVALSLAVPRLAAAEPEAVAVVACDSYGDLKKQIRWVGTLVGQPALDGFLESFIMPLTQFRGLAGLDVGRPLGLVVTAAEGVPVVHGYVPVKDLGKLLDALQGVTGPVEMAGDVRRIAPPGGMPLDIVEQDGWAIIGPQGSVPAVVDPVPLFDALVNPFTLGVQAFPSRMPEGMRRQFEAQLERAAATAAAQGQQFDREGVAGMLEGLSQTESVLLGVAIDGERERVYLESQSRMPPDSPAARVLAETARGVTTVASPPTADGKPPAVSLRLATALPESIRQAAIDGLGTVRAAEGSDVATDTAVALLKEAIAAMIAAGAYDAAVTIDTSGIGDGAASLVPVVTAGMRIKDGQALEAAVKKAVGVAGAVPGLKVAFDVGTVAGARLHRITLDPAGAPEAGAAAAARPVEITLAVAPTYAFVLSGGDVPARLAAVSAASGRPDPAATPLADVSLAVAPILRYLAAMGRAGNDTGADPAGLEAAAALADAETSALVQLLVRPIEDGTALRLSADAGAIRTVAASVKPQSSPAIPARPVVPAQPAPSSKPAAPALAP